MNNPLRWLYQQSGQSITLGDWQCYLCGHGCTESHTVAKGIADTFNSHYLAQCRSSQFLCDACAWYLDSKAGHPEYRKMSLVVTRYGWLNWARVDMKRDIACWLGMQEGFDAEAYLVVSLTKKKHILLQAPLNAPGSKRLAIQVEEQVAHVDLATWQAIELPFMALLALGHGKGEILGSNLYANTLRKHGRLMQAMHLSQQLDPWRNSPLIELYSYTTIIEKKEEHIDDGLGRRNAGTERATTGDATDGGGSPLANGRMEEYRPRLQESVSSGNLAAVRGTHRHSSTHDTHVAKVSEPSLWDAEDSSIGHG